MAAGRDGDISLPLRGGAFSGSSETAPPLLRKAGNATMRLPETLKTELLSSIQTVFGPVTVLLFGSSVHDEKTGGDIDRLCRSFSMRK